MVKYITLDERGIVQSVHAWLLGALHRRFTYGGVIYRRTRKSPMWWTPVSRSGSDIWFGTLGVTPGWQVKGRR